MTFDELKNEVFSITTRPDLVAQTELAIKQATLKMHQSDFYPRDMVNTVLQFEDLDFIQDFQLAVLANFRMFSYIRFYDMTQSDPATGLPVGLAGDYFKEVDPSLAIDSYSVDVPWRYYVAGQTVKLFAPVNFQYLLVGYYSNPTVSPATAFSSWIAEAHPYAIILEACRVIFKIIGFDEQAAQFDRFVAEQLALLKANNLKTSV